MHVILFTLACSGQSVALPFSYVRAIFSSFSYLHEPVAQTSSHSTMRHDSDKPAKIGNVRSILPIRIVYYLPTIRPSEFLASIFRYRNVATASVTSCRSNRMGHVVLAIIATFQMNFSQWLGSGPRFYCTPEAAQPVSLESQPATTTSTLRDFIFLPATYLFTPVENRIWITHYNEYLMNSMVKMTTFYGQVYLMGPIATYYIYYVMFTCVDCHDVSRLCAAGQNYARADIHNTYMKNVLESIG